VRAGWFTLPEPFFEGGLSAEQAAPVLDEALAGAIRTLMEGVGEGGEQGADGVGEAGPGVHVTGIWTVSIHVAGGSGEVVSVEVLADTLVGGGGGAAGGGG